MNHGCRRERASEHRTKRNVSRKGRKDFKPGFWIRLSSFLGKCVGVYIRKSLATSFFTKSNPAVSFRLGTERTTFKALIFHLELFFQILVLWTSQTTPPPSKWPVGGRGSDFVTVEVLPGNASPNPRFLPRPASLLPTDAVLSLDDDTVLSTDEVDFAFSVWRAFPERIVGYPARSHFWDVPRRQWAYSSRYANEYSMVLTNAAFYHRYYHHLFTESLSPVMLKTVEQAGDCEDILMNFLVSHVTRRSPIKLSQRSAHAHNGGSAAARARRANNNKMAVNNNNNGYFYYNTSSADSNR